MKQSEASKPFLAARSGGLPLSLCVGWGAGTLVTSTLGYATGTFLLRYLTDYLGMAAALAGSLLALSKIYDAVSDVAMGAISDRTRTRIGRRRPYLALGAVLAAISIWAIFSVPEELHGTRLTGYVLMLMLFWATAYTVFSVPYLTIPAEITRDPAERTRLISFRVYATAAASLLTGSFGPLLLVWFGGDRSAHGEMALVFAGVILGAGLWAFVATKGGNEQPVVSGYRSSFVRDALIVVRDGPFLRLAAVELTRLFGLTTFSTTIAFFTKYVLLAGDSMIAVIMTTQTLMMLVSQPFWVRTSNRVGKPASYSIAALLHASCSLLFLAVGPDTSIAVIAGISVAHGTAAGGLFLLNNAMLPDAIARSAMVTGARNEALFVSVLSFAEKLAFGFAGFAVGAILGLFGFVGGQDPAALGDSARTGILMTFCILPAMFVGCSALFLRGYKV